MIGFVFLILLNCYSSAELFWGTMPFVPKALNYLDNTEGVRTRLSHEGSVLNVYVHMKQRNKHAGISL